MKEDLFTFSIQQAETLGIDCAIVLAAAKTIKTELASPDEITASLKEKIPFLEEQEILKNIKRLIDLKLNLFRGQSLGKMSLPEVKIFTL